MDTDTTSVPARSKRALLYVVGAVTVFVICCAVQAAGDSSMFSTSYPDPENALLDVAMNVTFWPGWLLTGALLLKAGAVFFDMD